MTKRSVAPIRRSVIWSWSFLGHWSELVLGHSQRTVRPGRDHERSPQFAALEAAADPAGHEPPGLDLLPGPDGPVGRGGGGPLLDVGGNFQFVDAILSVREALSNFATA